MNPQIELPDDLSYRVRWVLGEETPDEPHCAACVKYAGVYANYRVMLEQTEGSVPGYFEGWAYPDDEDYEMNPGHYKGLACDGLCRCRLEIEINGTWGPLRG